MTTLPNLPGVSAEQWAADFLKAIGVPVTPITQGIVVRWELAESGGGGGRYNPLNTTERAPGSTSFNSVGVRNFVDYSSGVGANAKAFNNGLPAYGYQHIRAGLLAGDPAQTFQAIHDSSWGTKSLGRNTPLAGSDSGSGNLAGAATQNLAPGAGYDKKRPDDECVWEVSGPLGVGHLCVTRSQGRALLGVTAVAGGTVLLLVGLALMGASTRTGTTILTGALR